MVGLLLTFGVILKRIRARSGNSCGEKAQDSSRCIFTCKPDINGLAAAFFAVVSVCSAAFGLCRNNHSVSWDRVVSHFCRHVREGGYRALPFEEATALVTVGIFRFTRNPMYVGMFLMVFGSAFLMGSVGALIPLLIFMLIIRFNFVAGEERFMEAAFGQQYLDYKSKVRRWI